MKLTLSANICKLRKEHSMTQEQLAEALGVTFASVSKWERGVAKPELELIAEIADLFEVSIDTLVDHNLNADRMETLIAEMEKAVNDREENAASALCEKILRNYPNCNRAVDACASAYYKLYIHTNNKIYMKNCIAQTKRLMTLNTGEPECDRLARIHFLANQYELLEEWKTAKKYYEQSNVRQGMTMQEVVDLLADEYGWSDSVSNLSNKLQRESLRYTEAVQLADVLGYDIVWQKRRDK